jgi:CheY-like chemotaxis protein
MSKGILIADDDASIRSIVRTLVEADDYRMCGEAADAVEAIQQAKELPADLILLDLSMPRLNGAGAAGILRREMPDEVKPAAQRVRAGQPMFFATPSTFSKSCNGMAKRTHGFLKEIVIVSRLANGRYRPETPVTIPLKAVASYTGNGGVGERLKPAVLKFARLSRFVNKSIT